MSLVSCPDCQATVSDTAINCPKCGRPIKETTIQLTSKKWKSVQLWSWVVFFVGISLFFNGGETAIFGFLAILFSIGMGTYAKIMIWWNNK